MRAFIAIELSDAVRQALSSLVLRLRESRARVSWVRVENIHLTLRFLGEVDEPHIERLAGILRDAYKGIVPFTLSVRGTGAFPNLRKPSVIWVGAGPVEGPLGEVQLAAESAARAIGLPPEEKAFHPHLTLARIRDARGAGPLVARLEEERDFEGGEIPVNRVSLFSSELAPGGPVYTRVMEFGF